MPDGHAEADAHISATYAMLAAESLGLGSCMIGSASPFLVRSKQLLQKYGLRRSLSSVRWR